LDKEQAEVVNEILFELFDRLRRSKGKENQKLLASLATFVLKCLVAQTENGLNQEQFEKELSAILTTYMTKHTFNFVGFFHFLLEHPMIRPRILTTIIDSVPSGRNVFLICSPFGWSLFHRTDFEGKHGDKLLTDIIKSLKSTIEKLSQKKNIKWATKQVTPIFNFLDNIIKVALTKNGLPKTQKLFDSETFIKQLEAWETTSPKKTIIVKRLREGLVDETPKRKREEKPTTTKEEGNPKKKQKTTTPSQSSQKQKTN